MGDVGPISEHLLEQADQDHALRLVQPGGRRRLTSGRRQAVPQRCAVAGELQVLDPAVCSPDPTGQAALAIVAAVAGAVLVLNRERFETGWTSGGVT